MESQNSLKRPAEILVPPKKQLKLDDLFKKTSEKNPQSQDQFPREEIRIACWNVNGIRSVIKKPGVLEFCNRPDLDVLCFNETKLQESRTSEVRSKFSSYPYQCWNCSTAKLGYSGTAVLSRTKPISWSRGLEGHPPEGRVIAAEFDSFFLLCTYVPNSGADRLDYRVNSWDVDLRNYIKTLENTKPVVWVGDLNVVNKDIDIYRLKGSEKYAGATPEERSSFALTLGQGLVDSYRLLYPDKIKFSWFSLIDKTARGRYDGWRIDLAVVSEGFVHRLKDSVVHDDVEGSDHCPIEVIIKNRVS